MTFTRKKKLMLGTLLAAASIAALVLPEVPAAGQPRVRRAARFSRARTRSSNRRARRDRDNVRERDHRGQSRQRDFGRGRGRRRDFDRDGESNTSAGELANYQLSNAVANPQEFHRNERLRSFFFFLERRGDQPEELRGVTAELFFEPPRGEPQLVGVTHQLRLRQALNFKIKVDRFRMRTVGGRFVLRLKHDSSQIDMPINVVPVTFKLGSPVVRDHR